MCIIYRTVKIFMLQSHLHLLHLTFCSVNVAIQFASREFSQWTYIIENDLNENSNLSIKKLKS